MSFSTGQIFSFCMILAGLAWFLIASRLPDREPIRRYPDSGAGSAGGEADGRDLQREKARRRRKLRKKLR